MAGHSLASAEAAFRRGEYHAALPILEELAECGVPAACRILAEAHLHGQGVERDPRRAIALFQSAWQRGDAKAGMVLAHLLDPNEIYDDPVLEACRPKDGDRCRLIAEEASRGLELEARRGDGEAAYILSQCYSIGFGVPFSAVRALECLELAFELGYSFAANDLFSIYSSRSGGCFDRQRAEFFYREADRRGVRVVRDPEYDHNL